MNKELGWTNSKQLIPRYRSLTQRVRSLAFVAHSPLFVRNRARSLLEPRSDSVVCYNIF